MEQLLLDIRPFLMFLTLRWNFRKTVFKVFQAGNMNMEQEWMSSESDSIGTLDEEALRKGQMLTVGLTPMNRMLVSVLKDWDDIQASHQRDGLTTDGQKTKNIRVSYQDER